MCRDGFPERKYKLYPEYKSGREKSGYCVGNDIPEIIELGLLLPNVSLAYNDLEEADDVMYTLSKVCNRAYIFSGDDDLLQAINDRVKVVRQFDKGRLVEIGRESVISEERFVKKYHGCPPERLPVFRAIVGDKSDRIGGLARFPRDLALYVANTVDSVEEVDKIPPPSHLSIARKRRFYQLRQEKELLKRNYELMKLREVQVSFREESKKDTIYKVEKYGLREYMRYLRRWYNVG